MADLRDGESTEMKGSGAKPYVLKNVGGVYSCSCPAWRNQSAAIERRTCKHLRKLRGDAAEEARIGGSVTAKVVRSKADKEEVPGPPLLLAEKWDGTADLSGWWMSEKLDGVRAYWTGKEFLSRLGNLFHAPDWFAAGLPDEPLDGEFWIGRKQFQRTVSIVRRQDKNDLWKEVRYAVFDAPHQDEVFEQRFQRLQRIVRKNGPPSVLVHEHILCRSTDHLRTELARVEALGGEGLMLRQPGSKYEAGRSLTLLKVKTFSDAEAVVVGHEPGAGRHKGRLGALFVELADGTRFSVGTGLSDAERGSPPPIGSTITFRYQELTDAGVPRFPSYVGLRAEAALAESIPSAAPEEGESTPKRKSARRATPTPTPSTGTGGTRRFEYTSGDSNKFWEITVQGTEVTVRFGRTGATGQTQTKTFPVQAAARKHAAKLIQEKTSKGYVESAG